MTDNLNPCRKNLKSLNDNLHFGDRLWDISAVYVFISWCGFFQE